LKGQGNERLLTFESLSLFVLTSGASVFCDQTNFKQAPSQLVMSLTLGSSTFSFASTSIDSVCDKDRQHKRHG
jgi:hypothetical protein